MMHLHLLDESDSKIEEDRMIDLHLLHVSSIRPMQNKIEEDQG